MADVSAFDNGDGLQGARAAGLDGSRDDEESGEPRGGWPQRHGGRSGRVWRAQQVDRDSDDSAAADYRLDTKNLEGGRDHLIGGSLIEHSLGTPKRLRKV